jgi:hypothetical protein
MELRVTAVLAVVRSDGVGQGYAPGDYAVWSLSSFLSPNISSDRQHKTETTMKFSYVGHHKKLSTEINFDSFCSK